MRLLEKVRHLFNSSPDDVRTVSRNAMTLRRHVTEANEKGTIEMVNEFTNLRKMIESENF